MGGSPYVVTIDRTLVPCPAALALVWAKGIEAPRPTAQPRPFLVELLARVESAGEAFVPAGRRAAVRQMLRHGNYRPSGRGKPASEFLLRAATGGEFPWVNAPVDVNNAISLESGLPGSIFDAARSGPRLLLRRGEAGERYVFNRSGQEIDLEDLLVVCRRVEGAWVPCGNPVKDAMSTKISEATTDVVAVLYAPVELPFEELRGWGERFRDRLREICGASEAGVALVRP